MSVPLLDLNRQYKTIATEIRHRIEEVVEEQRFILGPSVEGFERTIADFLEVEHAVGVASGTDALLLTLRALDLKPDDEVIAPTFTFFATAGAIHNAGARPVFVDIEPDTFNISPQAVEDAITARTRAIVPVHLFGQMADMANIRALADQYNLFVLEDAAQAIGAMQKVNGGWLNVGAMGDAAALSFFPSKNLGGFGDGGMIVTNDHELAARLQKLRVHGGVKMYHHEEVGFNSRLDALQAAVLHAKVPHLKSWNCQRSSNAAWYSRRFHSLEAAGHVKSPITLEHNWPVYNQYTLRVKQREQLREFLSGRSIGSGIYYPVPLHLQRCFSYLGQRAGSLPRAERVADEVLSIPVFPELTEEERKRVADSIEEFYA